MRKLGNRNSSIKRQRETLEKTKTEIVNPDKKKNEASAQCQTLIPFIDTITKQVYYFNTFIDHYYDAISKKVNAASTVYPLLINIILHILTIKTKTKARNEKEQSDYFF